MCDVSNNAEFSKDAVFQRNFPNVAPVMGKNKIQFFLYKNILQNYHDPMVMGQLSQTGQ